MVLKINFASMAGRIEIELEPSGNLAKLVEDYISAKLKTEMPTVPEGYS